MKPYAELCLKCKGRLWCGLSYCPILSKKGHILKVKERIKGLKEEFSTLSNFAFVGRQNYPRINIGILGPIGEDEGEKVAYYDSPGLWRRKGFKIKDIINFRTSLLNSRKRNNQVRIFNDNYVQKVQEVALSVKPVGLDILLRKRPNLKLNFSPFTAPFGPNAPLKKLIVEDNPKINNKVEKFYYDIDAKANLAVTELYKKGIDENFLSKALSVGSFGVKAERKLVPTRWSITAVDDGIGRDLTKEIEKYAEADFQAHFSGYFGNYYIILFFPGVWSYELFEMYMPETDWNIGQELRYMTDYEDYYGRKKYAENCVGGYYASRLAVLERLKKIKRQASVLSIRVITPEYYAPLGVWVVREATRKAMGNKPIFFSDKDLLLKYAKSLAKKKFNIDLTPIFKKSKLLKNMKEQKKLESFW